MKNKVFSFLAIFVAGMMLCTGCGSKSEDAEVYAQYDNMGQSKAAGMSYAESVDSYSEESAESAGSAELEATSNSENATSAEDVTENNTQEVSARKIVYTADVSMETTKFDDAKKDIDKLIESFDGYCESTQLNGTKKECNRNAYFRVRIPVDSYRDFMNSVGDVAMVTSSSENAEDITSSYVDVEARISSLEKKKQRLEELEDAATEVDDLLSIETQISEVIYQIEQYTGTLNSYKDQVAKCTVNISIEEVPAYNKPAGGKETFISRLQSAFFGSMYGFKSFFEGLVIVILYIIPYAIVIGVIVFILKKTGFKFHIKKKSKKKKLEDNPEESEKTES